MEVAGSAPIIAASTLPLPRLPARDGALDLDAVRAGLQLVRSCGARFVDITDTWLPISELTEPDGAHLRSLLDDVGLSACGVSSVRHSIIHPGDGPDNVRHTRRAIALAATLGAPIVSVGFHEPLPARAAHVPFWAIETPQPARQDPVPLLRELADEAASVGVSIALELYEGGPLGSGHRAVEMIDQVGRPNVGINLDIGNLYRSPMSVEETWLETVLLCLPVTNFWHVKNYRRIYEYPTARIIGSIATNLSDGDIDYRRCLTAAAESGYQGPLVVEQYGGDGIIAQRAGVAYLEELVGAWA